MRLTPLSPSNLLPLLPSAGGWKGLPWNQGGEGWSVKEPNKVAKNHAYSSSLGCGHWLLLVPSGGLFLVLLAIIFFLRQSLVT